MKKIAIGLVILAVVLAACGTTPAQPTATDVPKSPPATDTLQPTKPSPTLTKMATPLSTEPSTSGEVPASNKTPSAVDLTPSPLDPLPDEENMIRGEAFVDSAEILLLESFPVQVNLHVAGTLPTPCHMLRANVNQPDDKGHIEVELYSLTEPGVICIQMLQPFDTSIPLGTYPTGTYSVYVNGEKAGDFTV